MERQSSFGSTSSAGSAFSKSPATPKIVKDAEKEHGPESGGGQNLLVALFGALYTLAKEKINDTAGVAMFAIWVDFLMIFTLLLMYEYPWKVNPDIWIYKVFYYIQIHLPIAYKGYMFYLVIFYILVAILFISVAICVWVGWCFMNDSFPFLWPIKVARVVVSLFVSMFYIASLNIFLMASACDKQGGHWKHIVFDVDCLALPHVIHAAFSIASGVVFLTVALLLALADHELEPMSKSLLAAPHSMCELRSLLCKTVITVADILFKPQPHTQVIMYTISCGLIFYYHARMVPHYVPWINVLRGGLNLVLAWVALMGCILSYTVHWEWDDHGHPHWHDDQYRHMMTIITVVGIPLMFLAGAGICWGRLLYAWKTALKFKVLPPNVKPRLLHRFSSEFDVEVSSRVGRVWDEDGVLDQTAVELAENVLKAGVAMMPNSVFLHIVYSNFLIEVRHNHQLGWSHLERAKRLEPNLSYQFSIFTRQQEHKQKSGGAGGEGSVDLVSYVEFQKNYRSLLVYHKASLVAARDFWRLLTLDVIPLERLGSSFKSMDEMESMAEKTYKLVLDRYPTNAKLLKSYGKFLESVKNDPWGAARYYAEAEKQEELAESAGPEYMGGELGGAVNERSAIITINAMGIIQSANKAACLLLGYKKGDLEGKNVSCLMPAPFSVRHNSYLHNYITTGKAKILDTMREVVALHKDRYVFPVRLTVSRVNGEGPDSVFMDVMKAVESDPNIVKGWLLTNGTTLCVDQSFVDLAGYTPSELVGKPFSSLVTAADSSLLDSAIVDCANYHEDELREGAVQVDASLQHKYAEDVPVRIKFEMGGTEEQRILVVEMRLLGEAVAMGSFDHKGRCVYANRALATMLGYKTTALHFKDISQLLPQPYGVLHLKWVQDADSMVAKQTPASCRNSMTTALLNSNGIATYVKMKITPHVPVAAQCLADFYAGNQNGADTIWAVRFERSSRTQLLDERRVVLLVSSDGSITWASPGTPGSLFAVQPTDLVGMHLSNLVDVFHDYCTVANGSDITAALAALLNCTASKPGITWRVGVSTAVSGKQEVQQEANGNTTVVTGSQMRILLRNSSVRSKLKPAIMVVAALSEDNVPEELLAANSEVGAVVVELWRTDMLLGVAEVAEGCTLVRVEPTVGLLLGTSHIGMLNTTLNKWLRLADGTELGDLMGTKGQKKGGLKSSRAQKIGPCKQASGMHADRRPVAMTLQATVKDDSHDGRLVLAIKAVKPLMGAPNLLAALIAADMGGVSQAGNQAGGTMVDGIEHSAVGLVRESVPGLNLGQVGPSTGRTDLMGTNTYYATYRSMGDSSMLATARGVKLDLVDSMEGSGTRGKGRAPAALRGSPRAGHEGHGKHGFGRHGSDDGHSAEGHDMDIDSEEQGSGHNRHTGPKPKKKPFTDQELEAEMGAKGAMKAQEWLERSYGGYIDDGAKEDPLPLPGAVEEEGGHLQLVKASELDDSEAAAAADCGPPRLMAGSEANSISHSQSSQVGDYQRGKRLRRLIRLLSSKQALETITGFKYKMLVLAVGILLLHLGSFAAIIGYMQQQTVHLTELLAAGKVADLSLRMATLAVVLMAAERVQGFAAADIPTYAAELDTTCNRYEDLHQGLYLGFKGLRPLTTPQLQHLWHENSLVATTFTNVSNRTAPSTQSVSLFNLGELYTAAAKDVQYAAQNPGSTQSDGVSLALNRQWLFMQANGPGLLYESYLHSLDFMVLLNQDGIVLLQRAMLALLSIEGFIIVVVAVSLMVKLLQTVSVHRQALFSVFLAIPHSYLRTLASKSVSLDDDDAEEDEEEKALRAEEDAKQKKKLKEAAQMAADAETDQPPAAGPNPKASMNGAGGPCIAPRRQRRASFLLSTMPDDGGTTIEVNAVTGVGSASGVSCKGKCAQASSGATFMADSMSAAPTERAKLFNGKELSASAKSAYQLAWPFVVWGILVMVLYGVSYQKLGEINNRIVAIKLSQRSLVQASRVTYYATRVALEPDASTRAALQPMLLSESDHLEEIYFAALYGGPTLADSIAHGSHDDSDGSLFSDSRHKYLLFEIQGCLRLNQGTCLSSDTPFYAVSNNGIDPMMHRLAQEAKLMGLMTPEEINPDGDSFGYVRNVAWRDLHDGLTQLVGLEIEMTKAAFGSQRTTQIVLLIVMLVGGAAFLLVMLSPFLKHISKESRRCAEMLAQLPPDLDVEGMVAATWAMVKEERILAERSGRTSLGTGLCTLSHMSGVSGPATTWQQQQPPIFPPTPGPMGKSFRSNAGGGYDDNERLFSLRQQPHQFTRQPDRSSGYGGQIGPPEGSRMGPSRSARGSMQGNMDDAAAGYNSMGAGRGQRNGDGWYEGSSSGGRGVGGSSGDGMRRRSLPGVPGSKALSWRQIVPIDDNQY